jgi:hypothetical protein
MWDRLTPSDIERAKDKLGLRRAETLARQAKELNELIANQTLVNTLEQAINAFVRKYSLPSADVVNFEAERERIAQD